MGELTTKARNALSSSSFVFPEERAYPIQDEAHARNALARGKQHDTGARLAKIVRAVKRRYPGIEVSDDLLRTARRQ